MHSSEAFEKRSPPSPFGQCDGNRARETATRASCSDAPPLAEAPLSSASAGDASRPNVIANAIAGDPGLLRLEPVGQDAPESAPAGGPGRARRERSGFVEALVLVLVALVMALTFKTYVADAYEIRGKSMEKTFRNGQRVAVMKAFFEIERGDIIVFASSEDPSKDLIKRVVGLPGETVRIVRGDVYINGKKIEEGYAQGDVRERRAHAVTEKVKPGHYYVLGDNRPDSHDSRAFHAIPAASIRGKVVARWWPLSDLEAF